MEKDSETSSDEETVTSKLRSRYMCSQCDREFESGHALSGHYNAHSKKRKRKCMPGSVAEPPVAPRNGSGFMTHGAPTLAVQSGVKINRRVDMHLAGTVTNPVAEVSRKENGDEDLDLDLRLGFGPA
uniref:C2H2-type domain-containing protein n=1 Tax=Salix viminalis TaxID=40686 RepID=A0A6N2MQK9_SALVM